VSENLDIGAGWIEVAGGCIFQHVDEPGICWRRAVRRRSLDWACPAECTDFVEMAVRPAHGGLQHKVQAIQADRQRHLKTAHDSRFDTIKLDSEAAIMPRADEPRG
jgi:hypothetical protein